MIQGSRCLEQVLHSQKKTSMPVPQVHRIFYLHGAHACRPQKIGSCTLLKFPIPHLPRQTELECTKHSHCCVASQVEQLLGSKLNQLLPLDAYLLTWPLRWLIHKLKFRNPLLSLQHPQPPRAHDPDNQHCLLNLCLD